MGREQLHPALAWIADKDGIPRGAGVLVTPRQVLTCAHVVSAALGLLPGQIGPAPEDPVGVRFTHVSDFSVCKARVRAARWFPPGAIGGADAGRGDIALLDLVDEPPSGAHPVPSFASGVGPPHDIHAYGLPKGHGQASGGWASGTLSGTQASGWIQIDSPPQGYRIQPGFSGAAAWSDEAGAVVGMIVAAEVSADTRVGWMIPASVIAQHCPEITLVPLSRDSAGPPLHEPASSGRMPGIKNAAFSPRVVKVINAPPLPGDMLENSGIKKEIIVSWIHEWFSSAKIIVNMGAGDGVTEGDYFDVLARHEPIEEDGLTIGYVDDSGSLIRAVQVQPQLSVCTLENWGYANFFKYVLPRRLLKRGIADTENLQPDYDLMAPIVKDDPVARIPSEEKDARDEVEDLYGRSLQDDADAKEKQLIYRDMIRRADRFLIRFPSGYFSGPMLYHKGYAQIKLNDYEDAIDTFDLYRRRYPFDSTEGADRYIREAKEALKQRASLRSDVALVTSARPTPQTWRESDDGMMSLLVSYDPSENTYRFRFSDSDHTETVAARITPGQRERVEQSIREVGALAHGVTGYSATETRDLLVNIGAQLWSELIPQQLHEQFWDRQDRIRQLTIISDDDDAIPWELLYPMDPGHDAGFLVEQFTVTRGISGMKSVRRLHLRPARFVISQPGQSNFQEEISALRQMLDPEQPQDAVISGLTPLLELIRHGGFGVLHFSCYNKYDPQNGVSIKLDKRFSPDNIATAAIMRPLAGSAPLVFINSSRSAGWARAFLKAGAGAFIGTLWPIRSTAALGFAVDLYRRLLEGASLGEAMARARRTIAANEADDPSSFAYTLYGDAQARAVSSKDQPGEDAAGGSSHDPV